MGIKLTIESKEAALNLCEILWKGGLLREVSASDIFLEDDAFPLEIPLEVEKLGKLLGNPLIKPYKRKIDTTLKENLVKVLV